MWGWLPLGATGHSEAGTGQAGQRPVLVAGRAAPIRGTGGDGRLKSRPPGGFTLDRTQLGKMYGLAPWASIQQPCCLLGLALLPAIGYTLIASVLCLVQ